MKTKSLKGTYFSLPTSLQSHQRTAKRKHHVKAVTTVGRQSTATSRSCHNTITTNEYIGKIAEICCVSNDNMN